MVRWPPPHVSLPWATLRGADVPIPASDRRAPLEHDMFPPSLASGKFTGSSAAHKAAENRARLAENWPPRPAPPVAPAARLARVRLSYPL